jgi:hypothetical protein
VTEEVATRKRGSRLAGVIVAALALGVIPFAFPASSQTGGEPELRDITVNACPVDDQGTAPTADDTTEVPEDGFTDTNDSPFEFEIDCVAWYDVTNGTSATTYTPLGTVSRGQMASFIANLVDYVDPGALDAVSDETDDFPCPSDPDELVPTDTHFDNIQRLADAEIVLGGPAGLPDDCYGPDLRVTRGQMASFIAQAQDFLGEPISPPDTTTTTVEDTTTTTVEDTTTTTVEDTTTTTVDANVTATQAGGSSGFFDDDDDSVHETNIELIASEGIAIGTSARTYQPGADIRRGQMAAFLARKLDYLVEAGATMPPPTATVTTLERTVIDGEASVAITSERGDIESATVTGCGITTATPLTVTGGEVATQDIEGITVTTACDLTFEITFVGGRTSTLVAELEAETA